MDAPTPAETPRAKVFRLWDEAVVTLLKETKLESKYPEATRFMREAVSKMPEGALAAFDGLSEDTLRGVFRKTLLETALPFVRARLPS